MSEKEYFTFCGDLVGTSSVYSNAPDVAFDTLSQFYNTVFIELESYQSKNRDERKVYMFSDSLIITGDNFEDFIRSMCRVYMGMLNSAILLRGGMVAGLLEFDPRRTRENFEKNLPLGDVLARANGLEKSVKGARFVIESKIGQKVLESMKNWLTLQGYIRDPFEGKDMLLERSVAPLASGGGYEVLYPVYCKHITSDDLVKLDIDKLRYLEAASPPEVAIHYTETLRLLDHSLLRRAHMATQA
jgi:hypothetical protein